MHFSVLLSTFLGIINNKYGLFLKPVKKGLFSLIKSGGKNVDRYQVSIELIGRFIKKAFSNYKNYVNYLSYLYSRLNVLKFHAVSRVGLDDAAATAIASCTLHNLLSMLAFIINSKKRVYSQKIEVSPIYNKYCFELDLNCIIEIRIGYIIITAIKLILHKLKGGEKGANTSN